MEKKVLAFCRQKELLRKGDRVLLGLSGGADSVCLFLILMALREELSLSVIPVHVHHNLRGEDADGDAKFCEELCRMHGLELTMASVPVAALAAAHGWSLEEAGRYARYEVFAQVAETQGCTRIAVAHHKNDQAETVLFQLLRGSRLKGLAGMEAKRGNVIRPLLCVTREEIEQFLAQKKQNYCIDQTNLEEDYTRNRIRHSILPTAEELQPKTVEHLAETAEYIGRVEQYLEDQTEKLWDLIAREQEEADIKLWIPALLQAEPLLAERVVYRALCEVSGRKKDMTALAVGQCMELCKKQTGRQMQLPQGLTAVREYEFLRIRKRQKEEAAFCIAVESLPWECKIPGTETVLRLMVCETEKNVAGFVEKAGGIPKSTCTKWFDYDTINLDISLRSPTAEDEIALYVDGRGKKVFEVLADAKIPKEDRKGKAVLAAGKQILWIPGIRASEAHRVTEKTQRILIATIDGGKKDGRED